MGEDQHEVSDEVLNKIVLNSSKYTKPMNFVRMCHMISVGRFEETHSKLSGYNN